MPWGAIFDIAGKSIEITNDEEKTFDPNFWNNPREAEAFMKLLRTKKKWVTDFETAKNNTEEAEILLDFYKEGEGTPEQVDAAFEKAENAIESLEFRNMLGEEGDDMSAVLQITAGAGGTESCDWAQMLMRMYLRWAQKK